tara:strand:- start:2731 stop:3996 length:1266 start_codon:yes stop_codon:yes gene_type:complete
VQTIDLGYTARQQFEPFHARAERWAVIVAHRRAGKTVACIHDLVDAALRCKKKNARFIYLAPFYRQAKDIAWQVLKDSVRPLGARVVVNESELRVDIGDKRIRLYGADNFDALRGIYADGIILDEYGDMDPRAWPEVIRACLSDRNGWAVFIGTPKGENDFFEKYTDADDDDDWYASILKSSETGIIPKSELVEMRKAMTREQYNQEMECSFKAAIIGAFYGSDIEQAEKEDRITSVPLESELDVYTSWDLGIGDATVIWAYQMIGKEIRMINHYEMSGEGLGHYAGILNGWKDDLGYRFKDHFLPHDVEVRELGTGKSRLETLRELGIHVKVAPKLSVEDGINAVRRILSRCWFDKENCAEGLRALRQYRVEYDDTRKTFRKSPLHDWTSHSADAFRYLAVSLPDRAKVKPINYSNAGII